MGDCSQSLFFRSAFDLNANKAVASDGGRMWGGVGVGFEEFDEGKTAAAVEKHRHNSIRKDITLIRNTK